jgi:general secretion pathway protein F
MPRYRYKAVTSAGEIIEGVIDATDRQVVVDRLHAQGSTPIRAEESGKVSARGSVRSLSLFGHRRRRLDPTTVMHATRELATLLRAGLTVDRAFSVLAEISDDDTVRAFLDDVLKSVRGGATLADALMPHKESLPAYYVGLVRAGEAGGALDGVMARLAEALERAQALRESVRSAMYYPAFVLIMSVLTLVVLFTLVIPEFRPMFEDGDHPMPTSLAAIIAISDGLKAYWWAIVAALLAIIVGIRRYVATPEGRRRIDHGILRAPLAGDLVTKLEVARFSRTLGTLLANGVMVLNALSITAEAISNRSIAEAIMSLSIRLKRGEGLAMPLTETGIFPRLAVQLVQVGEESGQLEAMLLRIADIYDEEVKRTLQRLLAMLVPVMTICIGIFVAGIIATMLTAILSTYDLSM